MMTNQNSDVKVFDLLNPIYFSKQLIEYKTINPDQTSLINDLIQQLKPFGFQCELLWFGGTSKENKPTPSIPNLLAYIGDDNPEKILILGGHSDVVTVNNANSWLHPPFKGTILDSNNNKITSQEKINNLKKGRIYGRGSADMKSGCAAIISSLCQASKKGAMPKNKGFMVLITGDEEGEALYGMKPLIEYAFKKFPQIKDCIICEPTAVEKTGDAIKIGRRGSVNFNLTMKSQGGHVAYPKLGDNIIDYFPMVIQELKKPMDQANEYFEESNLEVVDLQTLEPAWNVKPNNLKLSFNIRFSNTHTLNKLEQLISERVQNILDQTKVKYKLEIAKKPSEPFLCNSKQLLQDFSNSIKNRTGETPIYSTKGGTSDARFIHKFCNVIEYGIKANNIHQTNEFADIEDVLNLTHDLKNFIVNY